MNFDRYAFNSDRHEDDELTKFPADEILIYVMQNVVERLQINVNST